MLGMEKVAKKFRAKKAEKKQGKIKGFLKSLIEIPVKEKDALQDPAGIDQVEQVTEAQDFVEQKSIEDTFASSEQTRSRAQSNPDRERLRELGYRTRSIDKFFMGSALHLESNNTNGNEQDPQWQDLETDSDRKISKTGNNRHSYPDTSITSSDTSNEGSLSSSPIALFQEVFALDLEEHLDPPMHPEKRPEKEKVKFNLSPLQLDQLELREHDFVRKKTPRYLSQQVVHNQSKISSEYSTLPQADEKKKSKFDSLPFRRSNSKIKKSRERKDVLTIGINDIDPFTSSSESITTNSDSSDYESEYWSKEDREEEIKRNKIGRSDKFKSQTLSASHEREANLLDNPDVPRVDSADIEGSDITNGHQHQDAQTDFSGLTGDESAVTDCSEITESFTTPRVEFDKQLDEGANGRRPSGKLKSVVSSRVMVLTPRKGSLASPGFHKPDEKLVKKSNIKINYPGQGIFGAKQQDVISDENEFALTGSGLEL